VNGDGRRGANRAARLATEFAGAQQHTGGAMPPQPLNAARLNQPWRAGRLTNRIPRQSAAAALPRPARNGSVVLEIGPATGGASHRPALERFEIVELDPLEPLDAAPPAPPAPRPHGASKPSGGATLGVCTAEFAAKATASFLHFGLARMSCEAGFNALLAWAAPHSDVAAAIRDDPWLHGTSQAAAGALGLALAHHLGELYVRALIQKSFPVSLRCTDPADVLQPDESAVRERMLALQAAGRIGQLPADLIGLLTFGLAHGVRAWQGGESIWARALASGAGGGAMAVGHTLLNLGTCVEFGDSSLATAYIGPRPENVLAASYRHVAGHGSCAEQLGNISHDIFCTRLVTSLQGLLAGMLCGVALDAVSRGDSLADLQRFGKGMSVTMALVGISFFTNLSALAGRRGTTSGAYSGTRGALASLAPRSNWRRGGCSTLWASRRPGMAAQAFNAGLAVLDLAHHTIKTASNLPPHVLLDTISLAGRGIRAGCATLYNGLRGWCRRVRGASGPGALP
jgi:hypothetical protein